MAAARGRGRRRRRLDGAFALAILFEDHEELLVVARKGCPLAIGYGEDEMFVGSDALALAPLTDQIQYLEEGDIGFLDRKGAVVVDALGQPAAAADPADRA